MGLPWESSSWVILLMYLWCNISLWKNLVFLSPSLSHWTLNFLRHRIFFYGSSNSVCSSSSSFIKSVVLVPKMKVHCRASSLLSISFIRWSMFPKVVLFQSFICCLNFLRRCWNLYMQMPCSISAWAHQDFASHRKSGGRAKTSQNRKVWILVLLLCPGKGRWANGSSQFLEDYWPLWQGPLPAELPLQGSSLVGMPPAGVPIFGWTRWKFHLAGQWGFGTYHCLSPVVWCLLFSPPDSISCWSLRLTPN